VGKPTLHEIGCTFLGVNCSQSWADFLLWERLLNAHPELRSLVELGTGEGGFSRYLYLQAEARGLNFSTFDHVRMDGQRVPGFHKLDIFAHPDEVLARLISPTVLFCDNGDKSQEVNLFAPSLQPGDLVVVHDWNTEIAASDVPETLKPIHEEWWQTTAVFERP
jgi:hypothetical protein